MRILSGADVIKALPMHECITQMRTVMQATSANEVVMAERTAIELADGSGFLGMMPGSAKSPHAFGVKVMSILPGNAVKDRNVLQGVMVVFDARTGAPACVLDATALTAIRTAAVSAMATDLLARDNADTLAIFGTGVQAGSHLEAMLAVRDIKQVYVWGRNQSKAEAFCERQSNTHSVAIDFIGKPEAAAQNADIICTVTSAAEPILLNAWVRPGAHVNLVGSHDIHHRECDSELLSRARIYTDHTPFALKEAGEIASALADGVIAEADIVAEIGSVVENNQLGRKNSEEITLYKSLGLISQDIGAAKLALENADRHQLGAFSDFTVQPSLEAKAC